MKYGVKGYFFYDSDKEKLYIDFSEKYKENHLFYCCHCSCQHKNDSDRESAELAYKRRVEFFLKLAIRNFSEKIHLGLININDAQKAFNKFEGGRFKFEGLE